MSSWEYDPKQSPWIAKDSELAEGKYANLTRTELMAQLKARDIQLDYWRKRARGLFAIMESPSDETD